MPSRKTIYFTVTNDLSYDQRMQRICGSLAATGFRVVLVGRKMKDSLPLKDEPFEQKRLSLFFTKGRAFYIEFNIRLLFFLLPKRLNAICAIDLDTIVPCLLLSLCRRVARVYDAHELFTELKEVISRPRVHRFWLFVEQHTVPKYRLGYTVNSFIAGELARRYGVDYGVIRNLPRSISMPPSVESGLSFTCLQEQLPAKFFLYQGAVNEGRSFETLIPAMKDVKLPLVIAGDGNFMDRLKALCLAHQVQNKVILLGKVVPELLTQLTPKAYYGLTLFESTGMNQYYSLANRFFDYIHAGIPQLCVGYPEYQSVNNQYEVAVLITDLSSASLGRTLNKLVDDDVTYERLRLNCEEAGRNLNWEMEQQRLINFYNKILQ